MKCATSSKGKEKSRRLTRKKPIRRGKRGGITGGKSKSVKQKLRVREKITCIL
jgi:hypothetical protein